MKTASSLIYGRSPSGNGPIGINRTIIPFDRLPAELATRTPFPLTKQLPGLVVYEDIDTENTVLALDGPAAGLTLDLWRDQTGKEVITIIGLSANHDKADSRLIAGLGEIVDEETIIELTINNRYELDYLFVNYHNTFAYLRDEVTGDSLDDWNQTKSDITDWLPDDDPSHDLILDYASLTELINCDQGRTILYKLADRCSLFFASPLKNFTAGPSHS